MFGEKLASKSESDPVVYDGRMVIANKEHITFQRFKKDIPHGKYITFTHSKGQANFGPFYY